MFTFLMVTSAWVTAISALDLGIQVFKEGVFRARMPGSPVAIPINGVRSSTPLSRSTPQLELTSHRRNARRWLGEVDQLTEGG